MYNANRDLIEKDRRFCHLLWFCPLYHIKILYSIMQNPFQDLWYISFFCSSNFIYTLEKNATIRFTVFYLFKNLEDDNRCKYYTNKAIK